MGELRLCVVDRAGVAQELNARSGDVLMHVLRDKIDIMIGTCGGAISCGSCLVLLEDEAARRLPPASSDEVEMLDALGAEPGARLACQIILADALEGLRLVVAPEA